MTHPIASTVDPYPPGIHGGGGGFLHPDDLYTWLQAQGSGHFSEEFAVKHFPKLAKS